MTVGAQGKAKLLASSRTAAPGLAETNKRTWEKRLIRSLERTNCARRSVEKISQTLQEYRGILQKLFPNVHPDQLKGLSRERLVEISSKTTPYHPLSPRTPSVDDRPPPINPDVGSLEQLQPMPGEYSDAFDRRPAAIKGITDDVNMLSLHVNQNPSHLGISSVTAVLRVITWLDPDCLWLSRTPDRSIIASREASFAPENQTVDNETVQGDDVSTSPAWDEIPLINAYFTYIHPFIPLIKEQSFRDTYMAAERTDTRWLLLLNTVLAMGCIASRSAPDRGHQVYFNRLKPYLTIEVLDSTHLETVQALAILSGFYLHYIQTPNQASSLMGATLKIATMLGLHRDYSEGIGPAKAEKASYSNEMRRRVWWSVFMLDTWAGKSLGRPSMGRMSPAITVKLPREPIGQSDPLLLLVQDNIRFCMISTRMEDALAVSPLLDEIERQALDATYIEWFKHSSVLVSPASPTRSSMNESESPGITTLKNVMRWRYYTNRIFLHRPVLLWYAMRKITWDKLSPERKAAIELCREACADLINDIATTWRDHRPCQMAGWNANWLMYQAVMVPLLSLYSDPSDPNIVRSSRQQVEVAMATMRDLQPWSTTAKRSLEVVVQLYEASKRHHHAGSTRATSSSTTQTTEPQEVCIPTNMTPTSTSTPVLQHQQQHQQPLPNFRQSYVDISHHANGSTSAYGATTSQSRPPLSTASQQMYMDNMFDTIKWSTSWDSPMGGPQMTTTATSNGIGIGWDYSSMQHWAGMPHAGDEYFDVGFTQEADPSQIPVGFALEAYGAAAPFIVIEEIEL
ncbi:hypothetical protein H2202_010013 [Exophiala xenobiotica]|nr:hypothetical protein H2202_010013 [Exophiala xenobiotica]